MKTVEEIVAEKSDLKIVFDPRLRPNSANLGWGIWHGEYDDHELYQISILHELGHHLNSEVRGKRADDKLQEEREAWGTAFKLAYEYGLTFRPETIEWCKKQLSTYMFWEERESLIAETKYTSTLFSQIVKKALED